MRHQAVPPQQRLRDTRIELRRPVEVLKGPGGMTIDLPKSLLLVRFPIVRIRTFRQRKSALRQRAEEQNTRHV